MNDIISKEESKIVPVSGNYFLLEPTRNLDGRWTTTKTPIVAWKLITIEHRMQYLSRVITRPIVLKSYSDPNEKYGSWESCAIQHPNGLVYSVHTGQAISFDEWFKTLDERVLYA